MRARGYVGRLKKAMYGTRQAPLMRNQKVQETMKSLGFKASARVPSLYNHPVTHVTVIAHVDDFLCCGPYHGLLSLRKGLEEKFEIKTAILGDAEDEVSEATFLGRRIRVTTEGVEYSGDPKYADELIREWGLEKGSEVKMPGSHHEDGKIESGDDTALCAADATRYRRAAARINYIALDRGDIAYAAKEISRRMSCPRVRDVERIKRMLRYIKGKRRASYLYRWQNCPDKIEVYSDSDWAGCHETRRSTSGGVAMRGSHLIHQWSSTQSTVALSSAEAELNALVKAGVEGLGLAAIMEDTGHEGLIEIKTDSSAAKGVIHRQGSGKIKHLSVRQLWLQERVHREELKIMKVPRKDNPADALTHHWSETDGQLHFAKMNLIVSAS